MGRNVLNSYRGGYAPAVTVSQKDSTSVDRSTGQAHVIGGDLNNLHNPGVDGSTGTLGHLHEVA